MARLSRFGPSVNRKLPWIAGVSVALLILSLGGWSLLRRNAAPAKGEGDLELRLDVFAPTPIPEETLHEKKVRLAIQNGAAYLKERLLKKAAPGADGDAPFADTQTGSTALIGLALLEAGLPPEDAAVQLALAKVRKDSGQIQTVYVIASVIFFLNRFHRHSGAHSKEKKRDDAIRRTLALRLITGQVANGQWSYTCNILDAKGESALLQKLNTGSYTPRGGGRPYPSSALTQFAMLALWSALQDIPVRVPLLLTAKYFHESQLPDGAWAYNTRFAVHDSNTCAGLLSLALERALREDKEFRNDPIPIPPPHPKVEEIRRKGFARIGKAIGRKKDDPTTSHAPGRYFRAGALGDCYFLWCLERVAVIYGMDRIEGKDWYQWGSQVLVDVQEKNGSWVDRFDPAIDTSFAILFLSRANVAQDLTDRLQKLNSTGTR